MSNKDRTRLYDKNLVIPIFNRNAQVEERLLNIHIENINDTVQMKLRDPSEYSFNYTENIDLGDFEVMRVSQNLDINFSEFKCQLIEMLEQCQRKEMFLKCELSDQKCTLVFFGKSKIKCIVYLTVDLHTTCQKELFGELIGNLQHIQVANDRLQKQLSNARNVISEKEQQIELLTVTKNKMKKEFKNNFKQVNDLVSGKIIETQKLLQGKILNFKQRIDRSLEQVRIVKRDLGIQNESNAQLLKKIEDLRKESEINAELLGRLKTGNNELLNEKLYQEKHYLELKKILQEKESALMELQIKNNELKSDVEKAAIAITQKKATIDELSKDLVQANQMLVNFNNHYDNKSKQVEELQVAFSTKDKIIKEQRLRTEELLREFEEYKQKFNSEVQDKLKHELFLANNKIEELEKSIRKANKINTLLTEKVNSHNIGLNNY